MEKMDRNVVALHLKLDPELVARVDEWRYDNRIPSRKAAIEALLRAALPKPKGKKA
jgi:hypothetical protein